MDSDISFIVYVLFGAIGMGYFIYGKQQKKVIPLICGVGLMVYPYFVSNTTLLIVIGCAFLGMPFFIKY